MSDSRAGGGGGCCRLRVGGRRCCPLPSTQEGDDLNILPFCGCFDLISTLQQRMRLGSFFRRRETKRREPLTFLNATAMLEDDGVDITSFGLDDQVRDGGL